ncbi:MAG: hypothetical protein ACOYNF_01315 [Rhodoferax sp.]
MPASSKPSTACSITTKLIKPNWCDPSAPKYQGKASTGASTAAPVPR